MIDAPGPLHAHASATYQRLRETIAERMRMSHVVQPQRRTWPGGSWGAHGGQGSPSTGITRCKKGSYALVGGVAEGFYAAPDSDAHTDG